MAIEKPRKERNLRRLPWLVTPALVIGLLLMWQAATYIFDINPLILPSPVELGQSLITLVQESEMWVQSWVTLIEVLSGFVAGVVMGIVMGIVLGKIPWLEVSLRPIIVIAQVAPKVAFVPLFVIWFGFGMTSKVVLAAILSFFPVMLNVLLGVRSVEQGHREVMRSLSATRMQTFIQLEARSVLPYLFAGMEVAITLATTGAIVGEFLGGSKGLGAMVVTAMNSLQADRTFALILVLSIMGLILYLIVNEAKRFVIPWHESVYALNEGVMR